MKKTIAAALTLLVFVSVASRIGAQAQSTETARKHLESGIQFYEQGQYKQALNDFEIVVDVVTKAARGQVLITSYSMGDTAVRRGESFTKGTGATIA